MKHPISNISFVVQDTHCFPIDEKMCYSFKENVPKYVLKVSWTLPILLTLSQKSHETIMKSYIPVFGLPIYHGAEFALFQM